MHNELSANIESELEAAEIEMANERLEDFFYYRDEGNVRNQALELLFNQN